MDIFDYKSGIFSSKLTMFITALVGWDVSSMLAARDKHELRESLIKSGTLDFFYFIGDALLAGIGAWAIDRTRRSSELTKYTKFLGIPIPVAKNIAEIKVISQNRPDLKQTLKVSKINYFASLILATVSVGIALPLINQHITRQKIRREDQLSQ